jgi:ribosome-associated translation inhibitor RaiA
MNINFSFHNTDESCKIKAENYLTEEKLRSLTRLLQHGNFDLADLDIRVEYLSHHNNFLVKMDLKIARHVLVSEQDTHDLLEALDLSLEKIVVQLRKIEAIRHHK